MVNESDTVLRYVTLPVLYLIKLFRKLGCLPENIQCS